MHKPIDTWQLIHRSLQQTIEVMLLYVLESKGSSPGRQGFLMAVNAAGEMSGSLGGGIMEHKFIELAKSKLQESAPEVSIHHQIHDKRVARNQSGMICSGEQTIFLYKVKTAASESVDSLIASLQRNQNGRLQLSPAGIQFSHDIPNQNFECVINGDHDFLLIEKTGFKNKLYIIGGGHCSLALSQLMSRLDFYIYLVDERMQLNTIEQNNYVHEKISVADYTELTSLIPPGDHTYIVIMTVGYRTDTVALKSLVGKHFAYIGMLGSRNKVKTLFDEFRKNGIREAWVNTVHAPIGIPIKSQTTEEIAVSIAAEIIKIKNRDL